MNVIINYSLVFIKKSNKLLILTKRDPFQTNLRVYMTNIITQGGLKKFSVNLYKTELKIRLK